MRRSEVRGISAIEDVGEALVWALEDSWAKREVVRAGEIASATWREGRKLALTASVVVVVADGAVARARAEFIDVEDAIAVGVGVDQVWDAIAVYVGGSGC